MTAAPQQTLSRSHSALPRLQLSQPQSQALMYCRNRRPVNPYAANSTMRSLRPYSQPCDLAHSLSLDSRFCLKLACRACPLLVDSKNRPCRTPTRERFCRLALLAASTKKVVLEKPSLLRKLSEQFARSHTPSPTASPKLRPITSSMRMSWPRWPRWPSMILTAATTAQLLRHNFIFRREAYADSSALS